VTTAGGARFVGKLVSLQDRHNGLQKLAITDELTGLYNARYFRHFLSRIVDKARAMHFPVTLLLFDIDDFKKYNDQFGHGVGDEILRQVAALMKRCTRDHDLVARIGGDEFAVVFWDKEGPRQPKDPHSGSLPGRPPQAPREIFKRFQRLIASEDFPMLGTSGKGVLGISAGLAVFPYEASDIDGLLDRRQRLEIGEHLALVLRARDAQRGLAGFVLGSDDRPCGDERLHVRDTGLGGRVVQSRVSVIRDQPHVGAVAKPLPTEVTHEVRLDAPRGVEHVERLDIAVVLREQCAEREVRLMRELRGMRHLLAPHAELVRPLGGATLRREGKDDEEEEAHERRRGTSMR
jgi:GGDEF domain-containing protein